MTSKLTMNRFNERSVSPLFFTQNHRPRKSLSGFTLVELLTVVAIVLILSAASNWAIQSLSSAGTVDRAISDLSESIDFARTYALANHTYVRAVFAQVPATSARPAPTTLVILISPVSGELDAANDTLNMADPSKWPTVAHPIMLSNLLMNGALNATEPDTTQDAIPNQSDMVSTTASFTRKVGTISPDPTFSSCVQVSPAGEIQVLQGTPVRFIKMAFDKPTPQNGVNPFIVRVSGINGSVNILRKENGIQ
jgi:prepilin-type N-terminal cleavage/methylation domain-containing protein